MANKTKNQGMAIFDTAKLLLSLLLLIGAIWGFYHFSAESQLYRVLGFLLVVVIAVAISFTTAKGKQLTGFMKDSRTEVRKMVWPTRIETMQTTLMVVVIVILLAIFLWLVDMLLGWGIKSLLGG